ncbi:hypothetical protein LTR10_022929 [Elasticomyces elasticus]|uniref:Uncharacterized protein n=1 Tax=Exophiala sideris TaxID=1016849 RepID=A0ABR0J5Q9_9EURO|nr:hypothetical protein LTR10_022929 [Elasticomyces elasticus]KAK5028255.1 hypothetical protein LTS07_006346 [Exophiala sideris]KAK5036102.1 hypothetical protein LTR13_005672 [Exophiala sideris]KAK5057139.1 hypothetical protein LTR69_007777 [Exophiala sideris]KAK5181546.1 hypothetical protein LTR44_006341 [Eurotiomycetes sp. CCFEE 6388]
MAQKCVHKGCGKVFTDPDEECVYHPGPPEFHEGQKGWKCCKPRVLTFDEFLAIPPCTTGKHSTVDDTPAPPPKPAAEDIANIVSAAPTPAPVPVTKPLSTSLSAAEQPLPSSTPKPEPPEDESDDPDTQIPAGATCKRRGCGKSQSDKISRNDEECIYHPGAPIFHEGSKGWTCCKRRVLEFDEFMKIEGCKTKKRHCYVGKDKRKKQPDGTAAEEKLESVRNDFYQTTGTVIVSFYLKKIDRERAKVEFLASGTEIELDLPTSDGKRFSATIPLFAEIEPERSTFKIMGTKLEMELAKKDGTSWTTLRSDEEGKGHRIQVGRPGRV